MNFFIFIYPFLISLGIALITTPFTIKLAQKFNLIDDPKTHKHPAIIHTKPIPRAGGVPIFLGIFFATILFVHMSAEIVAILFAGLLVVIIGLFDDKYDLSPYLRFTTNIVLALLVVLSGVTIPFVTNPLGGILHFSQASSNIFFLPEILAVVWIVWVMNMLNWSKGVDGQMPGIAAISAIVIGIASLRFPILGSPNIVASQMSFIVAGASIGFLFFNFYPAKIFPGYSATILGFFLGILSIMSGVKLATAILVMGVPTIDALFTVLRRIFAKRSPFWHDKGHLHHLLLSVGLGQRSIAIFYWVMSCILGMIALNVSSRGKIFAIISLVVLVGAGIFTLKYITRKNEKNKSV